MKLDGQTRSQDVVVECPTLIIGFPVRVPLSEASQKCLDEVVEHRRRPMFYEPDWLPFSAPTKDATRRQDSGSSSLRPGQTNRSQQPIQTGGDGTTANKKPVEPKNFLEFSDLVW